MARKTLNNFKGMLFSLNGNDFMASYGKLEQAHKFYRGSIQTMALWSDTDGGGRFTKLVSLQFIGHLKRAIYNQWYKSGVAYNEMYGRKYKSPGKEWILHGNVINNISVIYRGRHVQTVGIRTTGSGAKVDQKGMDGKVYGKILIAKYAAINEFGFDNHPARPIFQPAMKDFISQHFPPMVKAFEKAMAKAALKEQQRLSRSSAKSSGKIGSAGDTTSSSSLGDLSNTNLDPKIMDMMARKNPDRDFTSDIMVEGLSADNRGVIKTKDVGVKDQSVENVSKDVNAAMAEFAKLTPDWDKGLYDTHDDDY